MSGEVRGQPRALAYSLNLRDALARGKKRRETR